MMCQANLKYLEFGRMEGGQNMLYFRVFVRPDIEKAVAFLTTRVSYPDER